MTDELNLEAIKARRYVANAPHDIRALVREVERLQARVMELETALYHISKLNPPNKELAMNTIHIIHVAARRALCSRED